jgi:hypothetical protein
MSCAKRSTAVQDDLKQTVLGALLTDMFMYTASILAVYSLIEGDQLAGLSIGAGSPRRPPLRRHLRGRPIGGSDFTTTKSLYPIIGY